MKKVELSIKEFVVFILRKWPVVLAFMLVFGILFGVMGEGPFQQQMLKKQAEYEAALEDYENALEMNAIRLSELEKERNEVKTNLEDSFLMNIDPDNKQVASVTIQVTGEDGKSVNSTIARQINERYYALARDASLEVLFGDFAAKEYDEKYLQSVYSVSKGTYDLVTVSVFGNKDLDAEKGVQAVFDYLLSKQDAVTEGSGLKHSISIISRSDSRVIDVSLKAEQAKQKKLLDTIESEIEALETLVLEKPEEPEPLAEPLKPKELDVPVITSYSFISQMPYGIAIGLVVSILMISLLYVLRLPVQLPEQLQRQLGIRYLGGIQKRI